MAVPRSPLKYSDFEDLIPGPDATVGEAIKLVLVRFPVVWWRFYSFRYKLNGDYSDAHNAMVCAAMADCTDNGVTLTT